MLSNFNSIYQRAQKGKKTVLRIDNSLQRDVTACYLRWSVLGCRGQQQQQPSERPWVAPADDDVAKVAKGKKESVDVVGNYALAEGEVATWKFSSCQQASLESVRRQPTIIDYPSRETIPTRNPLPIKSITIMILSFKVLRIIFFFFCFFILLNSSQVAADQ